MSQGRDREPGTAGEGWFTLYSCRRVSFRERTFGTSGPEVLEKEFMWWELGACTAEEATLFVSGSIDTLGINTTRKKFLRPLEEISRESISSVSLVAKDNTGHVVLSLSYDNQDRRSTIQLGRMMGRELAKKLK